MGSSRIRGTFHQVTVYRLHLIIIHRINQSVSGYKVCSGVVEVKPVAPGILYSTSIAGNVFLKAHILGSEGICFGGVYINILSLSVSPTFKIFSLVLFIVGMILFFISCKKVPNRTKYWV